MLKLCFSKEEKSHVYLLHLYLLTWWLLEDLIFFWKFFHPAQSIDTFFSNSFGMRIDNMVGRTYIKQMWPHSWKKFVLPNFKTPVKEIPVSPKNFFLYLTSLARQFFLTFNLNLLCYNLNLIPVTKDIEIISPSATVFSIFGNCYYLSSPF